MPRSRKVRQKPTTNVHHKEKKELKQQLIDVVQRCVDEYERVFVFTFENMRTNKFKDLRNEWKDSRFLLGRNKVMKLALEGGPGAGEKEYRPGLGKLAQHLNGMVGLLFTNRSAEEVRKYFKDYGELDYARAGAEATEQMVIPQGPIDQPHTLCPTLSKLGMPVKLEKGIIQCTRDYVVCEEGASLTPNQAKLLKLFGKPMAWFTISMQAMWESSTEKYSNVNV
eukprot:gb/GECG01015594.1/.p1 GENE.gb/GECG01015594.1/~~gb/GECG01015594.1/.p1  ORF type:complete len:224 (+),score=28.22 gb/GECG01015594.1/:1-672(+)